MRRLTRKLIDHPGPDAPFWVTPVLVLWSLGMGGLLVAGALLLTACRSDEQASAGVAEAGEKSVAATPAADPGNLLAEAPPPPSPAPALNRYAEVCLRSTTGAEAAGERTAACAEHLLETLRAVIGIHEVPQGEVGPRLDQAEVSVRHLGLTPDGEDAAALARQAALDLVVLAESVATFVDGAAAGDLAAARSAAEALDPEQPLADQGERLDALFQAADAAVRPLVRSAAPRTAADPA